MLELIKKYKFAIGAVVLLLIGWAIINVQLQQNAKLKKELKVAEYNLKVANDSVRITKDKLGREEANKLAYLTNSVKTLMELNAELAEEVRTIKGNVNTIIKSDVKLVDKPVPFVVKAELVDSTVTAMFEYDSTYSPGNYRKIQGYTQYNLRDGTVIARKQVDEMGISFTTGIKNLDKGTPEIFLKSDYPGFSITKLDGAVLDPKLFKAKQKTPLITPTLSVGWTPLTWDNRTQKVGMNPQQVGVTLGLGFNVFKLMGLKK